MSLLLILPILVSGFVTCNTDPKYFYKLHRYEGQYLYLKCAQLGILSLVIFSVLALIINKFVPTNISLCGWQIHLDIIFIIKELIKDISYTKTETELISLSWLIFVSIGSILFSYFLSKISSMILSLKTGSIEKSKILLMSGLLKDSPLDNIFFESYIKSEPLLLSLESRKVYVAAISSLGEPNEINGIDQEISIIPLMSGYRDASSMEVTFTTDYEKIKNDMNIVIRQEQIISATWFDFEIYKKLNLERKQKSSIGSSDLNESNTDSWKAKVRRNMKKLS